MKSYQNCIHIYIFNLLIYRDPVEVRIKNLYFYEANFSRGKNEMRYERRVRDDVSFSND